MFRLLRIPLAALVILFLFLWMIDLLRLRRLMSKGRGVGSVHMESVDAVTLKNGKTDLYVNPPQDVPCAESLFPHFGYSTCWQLRRNAQKQNDYFKDNTPRF